MIYSILNADRSVCAGTGSGAAALLAGLPPSIDFSSGSKVGHSGLMNRTDGEESQGDNQRRAMAPVEKMRQLGELYVPFSYTLANLHCSVYDWGSEFRPVWCAHATGFVSGRK